MRLVRLALLAALIPLACSSEERPPGIASPGMQQDAAVDPDAPLAPDNFRDGPPDPDAEGYCGNQFFNLTPEPPNLYFVLDRSGSMLEPASAGSAKSKYTAVRSAAIGLVGELGHRVNVGAAVFPGAPYTDECSSGKEVFSTRAGDPLSTYQGGDGPVTQGFAFATNVQPKGGTPIAATLSELLPLLEALEGKTAVVLMTDGGPNCSIESDCQPEDCIWNIEGAYLVDQWCTPDFNCCDPALLYGPGRRGCLDGAATVAAVAALRDVGVRTYVVGIAGSEFYVGLLDQLATVGGSARPVEPRYYRVDDISNLGGILAAIGNKALLTCDFALDEAPPNPQLVNVYLDQWLVPYDEVDGWSWTSETTLTLNGVACEKLESGLVAQVQVVAGCPTEQPL
ncbi:MAG: vWA domain-containing protein [Myxococcota bacterium]